MIAIAIVYGFVLGCAVHPTRRLIRRYRRAYGR
jgi:hypothetical protein